MNLLLSRQDAAAARRGGGTGGHIIACIGVSATATLVNVSELDRFHAIGPTVGTWIRRWGVGRRRCVKRQSPPPSGGAAAHRRLRLGPLKVWELRLQDYRFPKLLIATYALCTLIGLPGAEAEKAEQARKFERVLRLPLHLPCSFLLV